MIKVFATKSAIKDIIKIQEPFKSQIQSKIKELENFPNVINIKKLKNFAPAYRMRIGDYRVLFDLDTQNNALIISRILHRKEAYK